MKLIELVNARYSLGKLAGQDLPLPIAWQLMKLTDACNLHLRFYGEQREKLGIPSDPDPAFWETVDPDAIEKLEELEAMEVDDLPKPQIRIPIRDGLLLAAADVKRLSPLITFYEEE